MGVPERPAGPLQRLEVVCSQMLISPPRTAPGAPAPREAIGSRAKGALKPAQLVIAVEVERISPRRLDGLLGG